MVHRVLLHHSTCSIKSSWQCNSKPSLWSFLLLLYMFYLFYKTHNRLLIILLYKVSYLVAIKNKEKLFTSVALFHGSSFIRVDPSFDLILFSFCLRNIFYCFLVSLGNETSLKICFFLKCFFLLSLWGRYFHWF